VLLSKLKCSLGELFQEEEEKKTSSLLDEGNGVKLSSSRRISSAPSLQCVSQSREGKKRKKKEKDLFLPQTVKQTNKQRRLSLAVSCPLVLLICCLLAVILIIAFCALIWIGLVTLLLHLLVGEIENSN
jgi:Flp pilus assembly protein TadB